MSRNSEKIRSRIKPKNCTDGRLLLTAATLAVLVIAVFFRDKLWSVFDSDTYADNNRPEVNRKAASFENYVPPSEFGKVMKANFKPGAKKTVIYIVDHHPDSSIMQGSSVQEARLIQKAIYFILRDMLKKFDTVPVVVENWLKGLTAADLNLEYLRLRELGGVPTDAMLARLIRESDISERVKLAEENVGQCDLPAGLFAMLAHPGILPIGSADDRDLERVLELDSGLGSVSAVVSYPETIVCGEGRDSVALAVAKKRLAAGNRSKDIVDCVCSIRGGANAFLAAFAQDRLIAAPRREIEAAADCEGDAVVVAGSNHLAESIRLMDARGLSYIVVAPIGTEADFPTALTTPPQAIDLIPDDESGTCGQWEDKMRLETARELQRWLMEE